MTTTRPESVLVEPQADDPMPFPVSFIAGGNYSSPAYYISEIIKKTAGIDVFGWASEKITGDWEGVAKAAGAAGNLGRFNHAYAQQITAEWQKTAGATWRGNAAGNSEQYFKQLSGYLDFQVSPLHDIERQLTNISTGMRELGRRVGDALQDLTDEAITLAVTEAAAAASAATGIGALAAGAMEARAALSIVRIIRLVEKIMGMVETAYKTIYTGIGLLNSLSSHTTPDNLPPLPNKSYDFPGA